VATLFPRIIVPREATWPSQPGGLMDFGQSGRGQFRSVAAVGREWTESYPPIRSRAAATVGFLAQLLSFWRNGTLLDVDHRGMRTLFGTGAGTPVVAGASQTGASLATSGWAASQTVLRAGDVLQLPGRTLVYDVTADVVSSGTGTAAIPLNPPIYAGGSPTNGAALVLNTAPGTVKFRAIITNVAVPKAGPDEYYGGLTVTFREWVG
jgi:hypothetical protein